MNEFLLEMELREKRREFLKEAARRRLIRLHNDTRPPLHKGVRYRYMALVGNLLISWEERLTNRTTAASPLKVESCRS